EPAEPAGGRADRDLLAETLRDLDGPGAGAPGRAVAAARQADGGRDLDDLPEIATLPQPQYASLADLLG
ncbi:hypothetical protein, partial [Falsiroseomonas oryziterrae]|uniref:hypothetical protein n=1 Tax=Falsiroseomonas oryziterrae TaxID=2911368 RepID=UPI001F33592C